MLVESSSNPCAEYARAHIQSSLSQSKTNKEEVHKKKDDEHIDGRLGRLLFCSCLAFFSNLFFFPSQEMQHTDHKEQVNPSPLQRPTMTKIK